MQWQRAGQGGLGPGLSYVAWKGRLWVWICEGEGSVAVSRLHLLERLKTFTRGNSGFLDRSEVSRRYQMKLNVWYEPLILY